MDKDTRDLTPDEREDMAEDPGETPDEARQEERYDANAARLDRIEGMLADMAGVLQDISDAVTTYAAVAIDNGAELTDDDGDRELDLDPDPEPVKSVDELDLSM